MSVAGSVYSASPSYGRPSSPGSVIGTSSTFSGYKSGRRGSVEMSTAARLHKYIRRIFRRDQMDFEFALWQAVYLIINPQVVYRNFHYRKQTKNQYARDDPAFLVLVSVFLSFTSGMRWQLNQTTCTWIPKMYQSVRIPTAKLKIPGKVFLKSESRTFVTFKL